MAQTILLTGATGFVGSTLLGDILREDPSARVRLLVRAGSPEEGLRRITEAVRTISPEIDPRAIASRCDVFPGDVTKKNMGLDQTSFDALIGNVTHVIHCAASVSFQQSLDEARSTNVEGTRQVLNVARAIARKGSLERFAYVGTAYVAGYREGRIMEDDHQQPDRFSNTYEQSKYEAEQLVRDAMNELPCTILRPSIIVGHSRSGATLCFNVLYIPLRLIQKGLLRSITADPNTPLDVVPVDYVSRAIYELACKHEHSIGMTYHLTMGDAATTLGEVVTSAMSYFQNKGMRRSSVIFGKVLSAVADRVARTMSIFDVHLTTKRIFDNTRTLSALSSAGVEPASYESYYERLLQFCLTTEWGKAMPKAA